MSEAVVVAAPLAKDDVEDEYDDQCSSDGDDSEGSLVDFIVKGDEDEEEVPQKEEDTDFTGLDSKNILPAGSKRVRKRTKFFEEEMFSSPEYRKMMLCDVPDDEMHALEESDEDEESGGEEEDDDFSDESGSEEEEEESEEEEEESEEEEVSVKKQKREDS